jgi:protein-tyrosine-phosphatase
MEAASIRTRINRRLSIGGSTWNAIARLGRVHAHPAAAADTSRVRLALNAEACEDWEFADPSGKPLSTVRAIRDDIDGRVRTLLTDLTVTVS